MVSSKDSFFEQKLFALVSISTKKSASSDKSLLKIVDENKLEKIINETQSKPTNKTNEDRRYASLPWIPGLSQKLTVKQL